ncbi:MAG: FAD-binding oxidoreductase, partial [Puniceicoccales bacterium]|nr:FAD-binding oxidoreductase [Puniceicoccales bacterium]
MSHSATNVHFLIVGQGVAGTFLARVLIERGCSVLVVDDDQRASSSRVAAGLLNPITGMRLRLAEGTDELLENSKRLLARIATAHKHPVFTPMPIRRLYESPKERALKARRAVAQEYASLMSPDDAPRTVSGAIADEHGSFVINGGGWVDLPLLLDLEAAWLREQNALASGMVRFADLRPSNAGGVYWNGRYASKGIIFCNGYKVGQEPCWDWLPWQPAKGEIIDCETSINAMPWILNRSGWAIPLGDKRWRSGSTWEWEQLDEVPTPQAAPTLCERLQKFFTPTAQLRLVAHRAGVRPCVLGNQPFCGTHPRHPWLHLFGGLGPKGTFWGPTCAMRLADYLLEKKALPS